MERVLRLQLMLCLIVVALAGCASQPKFRASSPDWQNPDHGRVRENLVSLLRAAGRDPMGCSIFLFESKNLGATSEGNCMFAVSTGLASTGDERIIGGILASGVVDEVLGHADKRKAAHERAVVIGTILSFGASAAAGAAATRSAPPGPFGLGSLSTPSPRLILIQPASTFLFPACSASQQAEAEKKAAEILRTAGDPDPAGTMERASVRLRDAGIVEPWPEPEPAHIRRHKVMRAVASLVPGAERPTYTLGQKWIRSDGAYRLTRIDKDLYIFSAGPGQELHLTKDLMVAGAKKGGWVTEFDSLPKVWPLAVGKWGTGEGRWQVPNDPMRLPVKYTWSIDAYEEIQVPAGTFKAFRIVVSWESLSGSYSASNLKGGRVVTWYAPDVRQLVKAESGDLGPLTFQIISVDRSGTLPTDKGSPGNQPSPVGSPRPSAPTTQTE